MLWLTQLVKAVLMIVSNRYSVMADNFCICNSIFSFIALHFLHTSFCNLCLVSTICMLLTLLFLTSPFFQSTPLTKLSPSRGKSPKWRIKLESEIGGEPQSKIGGSCARFRLQIWEIKVTVYHC